MSSDNNLVQLKKALSSIRELRARLETVEQQQHEPIAIIGMGCRFPGGAHSPDQYWDLLANGVDAIQETPADRWDIERLYDSDPEATGKIASRYGGYIDGVDQFDPDFFGISPKEAALMDPQQRLFLQVAWEALENAGQTRDSLAGSQTGVFVGMHSHSIDYYLMQTQALDEIEMYTGTGTSHSVTGGRLSYIFDLRGPNVTLDTACSSSLVATHLAVQSLRTRESDMAVAGGVNLMLSPEFSVSASRMHMLAPDGRCKTFDQRADGFVRGEGCGAIVLKRLADAQRDGDPILAVIRGSAVNQDGKTNGLTAPNSLSQEAVIRSALANAGIDRSAVSYIEAHGTGTSLGDPIEVEALAAVLSDPAAKRSDVYLGSAKTNIGHLEGAAGVAGIIKVVLSMQHKAIPPLLHFTGLNPHISFEQTPFKVTTSLIPWAGDQRFAGISSFGWSGTNAHLILESATGTAPDAAQVNTQAVLLPLSAPSAQGLAAVAQAYHTYLTNGAGRELSLNQIAYTASLRRTPFEQRLAVAGQSHEEIAARLENFISKGGQANRIANDEAQVTRKIAFLFPGQGGQWVGMGQRLLEREPVFRATLERIDAAIQQFAHWSLLDELRTGLHFEAIDIIQPAIFAIQVGLAELWRSWGIEPDTIIGHSMGEVAGAYISGILSLEDAVRIICRRSQLMKQLSNQGAMAVIGLSYDEALALLEQAGVANQLGIGVSNSPRSTVLSGDPAALETVLAKLREQNIFCRPVNVDVAAHSPQMEALRPELVRDLGTLQVNNAAVPVYSTVTGQEQAGSAFNAAYWGANLRQPVLFAKAVQQALADGYNTFIEIGPHPVLLTAVEQNIQHVGSTGLTLASMRRDEDETTVMLEALGGLYMAGYNVDWKRLYPTPQQVVQLPSYPWSNQRFWIEPGSKKSRSVSGGHPLIGQRLPSVAQLPNSFIWENVLEKSFTRYIGTHFSQTSDETVYQAMALTAAEELYGHGAHTVSEIRVSHPLPDATHTEHVAQLVLESSDENITFHVFSRPAEPENAAWIEQAHGQIQRDLTESDWLYEPEWIASEPVNNPSSISGQHWLIFANQNRLGQVLAEKIAVAGAHYTTVYAGDLYRANAEQHSYTIDPTNKADYERLFAELPACDRIVYLWPLDLPGANQFDEAAIRSLQVVGTDSIAYMVQILAGLEWSHSTHLWLVTRDAVGGLRTAPHEGVGQSLVWGFGRTIALEHPDFWGGLIDLPSDGNLERDAGWIVREVASTSAEDQIAYEQDQRYVARLVRKDNHPADSFTWRSDSTYLITGGLGGLGLLMARWLAGQGVRHLALIGRRTPSSETQVILDELTAQGVQVLAISADVSKAGDVKRVLAEIEHHAPPLKGIIHSAAVIDNGIVMKLTHDQIERVLSPKVTGTWNLHQLTQGLDLDCFITFSSFASLFGIAGESNYAAANAFVDSLMHYRRATGHAALAVNWGTWDEYGRAMEMRQFLGTLGLELMAPAKALAALTTLLRVNATEAVVADIHWEAFKAYYMTARQRRFLDQIKLESAASSVPQKAQQSFSEVLASAAPDKRRDLILSVIRDEAASVLGFKPAESLDIKRGFFTLGMDSLMSVQLRNRLEHQFGCFLPPTVAFEYPTIEALTNYVLDEVFKLAQPIAEKQPEMIEETVMDVSTLSQDDLMSLLDDELRNINKLIGDD